MKLTDGYWLMRPGRRAPDDRFVAGVAEHGIPLSVLHFDSADARLPEIHPPH